VGPLKLAVVFIDLSVLQIFEPIAHALVGTLDRPVLPLFDLFHIHSDRPADHYPKVSPTPSYVSGMGTGHKGLGRNSAGVDAGATKQLAFYDGYSHSLTGQACGQ